MLHTDTSPFILASRKIVSNFLPGFLGQLSCKTGERKTVARSALALGSGAGIPPGLPPPRLQGPGALSLVGTGKARHVTAGGREAERAAEAASPPSLTFLFLQQLQAIDDEAEIDAQALGLEPGAQHPGQSRNWRARQKAPVSRARDLRRPHRTAVSGKDPERRRRSLPACLG